MDVWFSSAHKTCFTWCFTMFHHWYWPILCSKQHWCESPPALPEDSARWLQHVSAWRELIAVFNGLRKNRNFSGAAKKKRSRWARQKHAKTIKVQRKCRVGLNLAYVPQTSPNNATWKLMKIMLYRSVFGQAMTSSSCDMLEKFGAIWCNRRAVAEEPSSKNLRRRYTNEAFFSLSIPK